MFLLCCIERSVKTLRALLELLIDDIARGAARLHMHDLILSSMLRTLDPKLKFDII